MFAGGSPQQALIQSLARSYQGPNPPWATQPLYIDGIHGATRTIPAQQTPYGAFHDPTDGEDGYAGNQVGSIAAGQPPVPHFNPGGPMQRYPIGHSAPLHPLIQSALDNVRKERGDERFASGRVIPPGLEGHHAIAQQLPLNLLDPASQRAQAVAMQHRLATLFSQLSQRSLTRNQYGGRH